MRVQPLCRGADRDRRGVMRQLGFAHSGCRCASRREHTQLRAGVEEGINPAAVELHRKEQVIAERAARGDRSIGTCPGWRRLLARLLAVKRHLVTREIKVDVEATQNISAENSVER